MVLKVLEPDHSIFKKDYAYYKPYDPSTIHRIAAVNNNDGLFDGLPVLPAHILAKQKHLRLTKPEKLKLQQKYLEDKQLKTYRKLQEIKKRIAESNQVSNNFDHF